MVEIPKGCGKVPQDGDVWRWDYPKEASVAEGYSKSPCGSLRGKYDSDFKKRPESFCWLCRECSIKVGLIW